MLIKEEFKMISTTSTDPFVDDLTAFNNTDHFCLRILYQEIEDSRVRIWDLCILIPNLIFMLFLAARFNRARLKLRATGFPTFFTVYTLVIVNTVISVVRCLVAMSVNAADSLAEEVDKVLWIAVRFFLLSTELSVIIFCLAFGHLDSSTSIRRVLLFTSLLSLVFSITQGALELLQPDLNFRKFTRDYHIFAHGGMLFWFIICILFCMIYTTISILPWTRLRERLALPTKQSFYYYTLFLSILNLVQALGSGMLYFSLKTSGFVVDVTTFLYFTLFTPLVYKTFLSEFFNVTQPSIWFSYKTQVDEVNNSLYDSTQFEASTPVNPLYAHSLQSPDSITGGYAYNMSRSNSINSDPGYQQEFSKQLSMSINWKKVSSTLLYFCLIDRIERIE
uniref:Transmembrane protein adipocyte-associated 1 homolog n=1 Tax=Strigamia maritima TaxID=126957 RepID=T1IHL4_STRMM